MNSIEKTLAVLRVLATPDPPHALAEIAKRAEVNKTTAHRILQTLVRNNYAQAHGEGAYAPGAALLALGGSPRSAADVVAAARPILDQLQSVTGHTVHFAIRSGRVAVYSAKIEGDKPYQMASRVGTQIKLHCTAIGKAILAALPPDEVGYLLAAPEGEHIHGDGIRVDVKKLHAELAEVAQRGYAIDDEENEANIRCVGAVVRAAGDSVIGGISVSGLTFMFSLQDALSIGPTVAAAAGRVSAMLGHRGTVRS